VGSLARSKLAGLREDRGCREQQAARAASRLCGTIAPRRIVRDQADRHVALGSAEAYFQEGRAGRVVGRRTIEANVERAVAEADGLFRVWSMIMSDPAGFPMFKGGYPLTPAAEAALTQWNPQDNALLRCGTKGTPLIMTTPRPIEFVRQGDDILLRIEECDARRVIHMSPDAVPPVEHTLCGFSRGR
jgi:hypothetical protein